MARILTVVALAAFAALGSAPASACELTTGGINVCLSEQECSGAVSVCPMADPDNCHSYIDVCLDFVGPR